MRDALLKQIEILENEMALIKRLMGGPYARPVDSVRAGRIGRDIQELRERLGEVDGLEACMGDSADVDSPAKEKAVQDYVRARDPHDCMRHVERSKMIYDFGMGYDAKTAETSSASGEGA